MTKIVSEPQEFLKQFFGDGNSIRWDQYESGEPTDPIRSTLEPWVTRFEKRRSPFFLPRVNPETKQTVWYVLCSGPREARSMRETLQAFIGPTYADFNGEFAALADGDAIDQICHTHFGSLVFRLPVAYGNDRKKVNSLLTTLIDFRDREVSRSLASVKPLGRLFRDLEMAIIACNEESAWQIYSELRSRGRLSAVNLSFLQVHIYGAFDHWAEIISMPNLSDLLQVRRPKRISEQIAKAVYRQYFREHEEANSTQSAIDTYRSVGARFQSLVRSTERFQIPDAIKFAVLSFVAANPPNRKLAERLFDNSVSEADRPWCESLLSTLETPATTEVIPKVVATQDVADMLYIENNFDEALISYLGQTPSYRSVCRVLETAVEVDSNVAAGKAIEYFRSAPDDIRGKVSERRVCSSHIEILTGILGKNTIDDTKCIASLEDWFQSLDHGENLGNAHQALEYGIHDWMHRSRFDPARIADLLRLPRTGKAAEVIRNAVPTFMRSCLVDQPASREDKPIYVSLMELLIYDDTIGTDDLAAIEQLAEAVLTTAPSHQAGNNDFTFAADITVHLWETIAAPRHLDWVLSMLDLLIDTGAQRHTDLTPILAAIVDSSRAWTRRVRDDQWSLFELLARDLNLSELVNGLRPQVEEDTDVEEANIRELLKGMSIAVYSLSERIARRFGQLAKQTFNDIDIHYLHDKSLTDRMKSLARSADIFIINTWDAKHAATNGIKDNRSNAAVTLEPDGKSATSLLRCLQEFAIKS